MFFYIYSVSCGLSAAPAPGGTGRHRSAPGGTGAYRHRHRHRHQPAQTGPDRHQPAPAPTGTDRFGPAPDRPQLAWTGTSLGPVCAGPYRVSNGLCRSISKVKHRHRPLETRNGPAQTGSRLVTVQASWGRSGAGLNRSVSVGAGAALPRYRPVPLPWRDRKKH